MLLSTKRQQTIIPSTNTAPHGITQQNILWYVTPEQQLSGHH